MIDTLKDYYRLTKPGIIYGNLITTAAGFLLASPHQIYFRLLTESLAGVALVIASACVFNNYLDRDIDTKMTRTRNRAIAKGRVAGWRALSYAALLGTAGFLILAIYTNWLVVSLGAAALFFYVILYGLAKRLTVYSTLIGSIPGATPPAAGYLAVTNHVDGAAISLFLILVFWQMPHFYAIAMYRYNDYKAAGLPVLTVKRGLLAAKRQVIAYIIAFMVAVSLLRLFGYTGYIYLVGCLGLCLFWLYSGLANYQTDSYEVWGRKMFLASLGVTLGTSFLIAFGARWP